MVWLDAVKNENRKFVFSTNVPGKNGKISFFIINSASGTEAFPETAMTEIIKKEFSEYAIKVLPVEHAVSSDENVSVVFRNGGDLIIFTNYNVGSDGEINVYSLSREYLEMIFYTNEGSSYSLQETDWVLNAGTGKYETIISDPGTDKFLVNMLDQVNDTVLGGYQYIPGTGIKIFSDTQTDVKIFVHNFSSKNNFSKTIIETNWFFSEGEYKVTINPAEHGLWAKDAIGVKIKDYEQYNLYAKNSVSETGVVTISSDFPVVIDVDLFEMNPYTKLTFQPEDWIDRVKTGDAIIINNLLTEENRAVAAPGGFAEVLIGETMNLIIDSSIQLGSEGKVIYTVIGVNEDKSEIILDKNIAYESGKNYEMTISGNTGEYLGEFVLNDTGDYVLIIKFKDFQELSPFVPIEQINVLESNTSINKKDAEELRKLSKNILITFKETQKTRILT